MDLVADCQNRCVLMDQYYLRRISLISIGIINARIDGCFMITIDFTT
jgi:hypothetical protein